MSDERETTSDHFRSSSAHHLIIPSRASDSHCLSAVICRLSLITITITYHFSRRTLLARDDLIPAEGTIIDKQPNAFFKVQLDNTQHVVLAAISGKMRKNRIRILVGDRVSVEMSPYDLTRGRITYRYK